VGVGQNPFGKDVANAELFTALARHGGYDEFDILAHVRLDEGDLEPFRRGAGPGARIVADSIMEQRIAAAAGALLRGRSDLSELAWLRRRTVGDRAYSLLGLIHTLGPPTTRQTIAMASVAPVHPWDALICTSPSVLDITQRLFEDWCDHLGERFGGAQRPIPRLALIPLGVDQAALQAQADRPQVRAAARAELGVGEDDVLVLWVGRLSYFEKAFPQPMFRAVQEAALATGARVHFVMAGWFPDETTQRPFYEAAAQAYAPSVSVSFLDGNDRERVGGLWAAADIFLSLVDNVQETFGITPVEAMAAGLPVVASDWDGYRFTVRDGHEGFLAPTLGGPTGALGPALAARHGLGMDAYQVYAGVAAQYTAVNVGRAAGALAQLIASPELRRRMGAAGRARARETFDWPVVVRQINALVDELAEIRAAAADAPARRLENPVNRDPFIDFAAFASRGYDLDMPIAARPGARRP
jgi:glycosyltransferase involved in cell wall biosynthesis